MTRLPIIVDLDGTLSRTDTLVEAMLALMFRQPTSTPAMLSALREGPAHLKDYLVTRGFYAVETVPLRQDLVDYLQDQVDQGAELHLVTASPQTVADQIAERLPIFKTATGTREGHNLKGDAKRAFIEETFPDGFVYAGNDKSDIAVWEKSQGIIVAGSESGVTEAAEALEPPVIATFPDAKVGFRMWLKALRIHQWSKNVLMFVPLVLAHLYGDVSLVAQVLVGFVCMGMVASATYLFNDLSDLDADRRHRTKHKRALASGLIQPQHAVALGAGLVFLGFLGAFVLDLEFALLMAAYVVLTVSYSLHLKRVPLLDVFVLGLLFTSRILMGIEILEVPTSPWLMAFSVFFFFSLSLAKRHVEVIRAVKRGETGQIKGRGYRAEDAPLTLTYGISSSLAAVTLLFLYIVNDAASQQYYGNPEWLAAITGMVFLWTCRIWLKSHHGSLDDDPVVFAIKDRLSWAMGGGVLLFLVLALA